MVDNKNLRVATPDVLFLLSELQLEWHFAKPEKAEAKAIPFVGEYILRICKPY